MVDDVAKAAVLLVLDAAPNQLPLRTVLITLAVEYRIMVTMNDLDAAFRVFEEQRLILGVKAADLVVWSVSAEGRAWLAERVHGSH